MIKFQHTEIYGWEAAVRGARNPLMSWAKSDTKGELVYPDLNGVDLYSRPSGIGPNDMELLLKLAKAGPEHAKYLRMIGVTVDITAPLYWWKQMDQYKVGTVTNSTSTMHTIHKEMLELENLSCDAYDDIDKEIMTAMLDHINRRIASYNYHMDNGDHEGAKQIWRAVIQMIPNSYNQTRTWSANYAVLRNIYRQRRNHRLSEWSGKGGFCEWIEGLPYSELITET